MDSITFETQKLVRRLAILPLKVDLHIEKQHGAETVARSIDIR
jgi:hypothetical protein